jgi:hypothetical protein
MRPFQATLVFMILAAVPTAAQEAVSRAVRLEARPATATVEVGSSVPLVVVALDASGEVVDTPIRVVGARGRLSWEDGRVTGLSAGTHELIATLVVGEGEEPIALRVPVSVEWPAVTRIEIEAEAGDLYAGTTLRRIDRCPSSADFRRRSGAVAIAARGAERISVSLDRAAHGAQGFIAAGGDAQSGSAVIGYE